MMFTPTIAAEQYVTERSNHRGPAPEFTALRFFDNVEGWVPHWTESDIAGKFDRIDQL